MLKKLLRKLTRIRGKSSRESRLNGRLILRTVIVCVVLGGTAYGLRTYFIYRNCDVLQQRAADAAEAGELDRAVGLYQQYLQLGRSIGRLDAHGQADVLEQIVGLQERSARDSRLIFTLVSEEEELLRLAPGRSAIRSRLVERLRAMGRFGDAVAHLQLLKKELPAGELADIEDRIAQCQYALRQFADAQASWGRCLSAAPQRTMAYLGLAKLWSETEVAPEIPEALASRSAEWGEFQKRLTDSVAANALRGRQAAAGLLTLMRAEIPGPAASLAMVRFLLDLSDGRDASPKSAQAILDETQATFASLDLNRNEELDGVEVWDVRVPVFADRNADGRISREELQTRLARPDSVARLDYAEGVLAVAAEATAIERIPLELDLTHTRSTMLQETDPKQSRELQRRTREIAESGLEHAELRPRCELMLAQLDLDAAATAQALSERESALKAAEQHARQGLAALPQTGPQFQFSESTVDTFESRQRLKLSLADALLLQCEGLADADRAPLLTETTRLIADLESAGLESVVVESLRLHTALLKRNAAEMLAIASRLKDRVDSARSWRRRATGLLVRVFHEIGHPEQAVDALNAMARNEPLSAGIQFSLAEALIAAGRSTEAIPHLKAASNVPGAALRLCSILQRQLVGLPAGERNWSALDAALEIARKVSPDTPELTATELSILRLKLWTSAVLRAGGGAPRLVDSEVEQLDRGFSTACERFPADATLRVARLQFTGERRDLSEEERQRRLDEQLATAEAALGKTPQLLLAEASMHLPKNEADAREYLQGIERRSAELPATGQAAVLSSLALWWTARENWSEAIRLSEAACAAVPQNSQLRLQLVETLLRSVSAEPDREMPESLWEKSLAAVGKTEGTPDGTVAYLKAWRKLLELRGEENAARRQQQLDEARQLIQQVARWRPTWSAAPRLRGLLLSLSGQQDAASKEWEHAYRLGDRSQEVILAVFEKRSREGRETEITDMIRQLEAEDQSQLLGAVGRSVSAWEADRRQFEHATRVARRVAAKSGDARDELFAWQLGAAANKGVSDVSDADILAFVIGRGSALREAWEFFLLQRLRRAAPVADLHDVIARAEQHLPADPPERKPWTLARLHEILGSERPDQRAAGWPMAMEQYRTALKAGDRPDLRLAAVQMSLRFRNSQETAELLQPLRDALASLPEDQQRIFHLLTAQLALRDPGPAGRGLLRESLLEAIRLGERSRATLQTLAAALEREATSAELTSAAALVGGFPNAENEPYSGLAVARILALAGRWTEAAERYQALEDAFPTHTAVKVAHLQQILRRMESDPELAAEAERVLQRLEAVAPQAWETARSRAILLQATGQTAPAIGLLTRTAEARLSQDSATLINEWLARPDFQAEGEQLATLLPVDAALRAAWDDVVAGLSRSEASAARAALAKPQLAPLIEEWRLLAIGEAANLLERLGAVAEAERLLRQMVPLSSRPARIQELVAFLVRQQQPVEALDVIESHWARFDATTAAATASTIARMPGVPLERIRALQARVVESAQAAADSAGQARLQLIVGDLAQSVQDWENAFTAYSRVTELEPSNAVGLNNTAFMAAKLQKDPERARGAIQQAIALAGPLPDLLDTSASVSIETGSPQTAVRDLQQSPELVRRGGLQARLAEAYWQLGQKDEAIAAWRRARKLGWTLEQSHPLDRDRHGEIDRAEPVTVSPSR